MMPGLKWPGIGDNCKENIRNMIVIIGNEWSGNS